jgi:zinc/manganese transport system ATP-binding protein
MSNRMSASIGPGALTLRDLTVAYRAHPAIHHLSGTFAPGSCTAVIGPNGAGKSTLLGVLAGRVAPTSGGIGRDAATRTAYLPQQADIDRSFPITVRDVVAMGLWSRLGAFRRVSRADDTAISAALAQTGLAGFERRLIGELSTGQTQRVLFARLMLQDADVVLLDEPFNAVDERTTADLLAVVRRWHAEGRTVIAVLHDMAQVRAHFERTLLLAREVVAWGPTDAVLHEQALRRARQMVEAWDEAAPACEAHGAPPAPLSAPSPVDAVSGHGPAQAHGHSHVHASAHAHAHGHSHAQPHRH